MAGLGDMERPLSPRFLRRAFAFLGASLAGLAAVNLLIGLGALLGGRFGAALVEFTAGTAIPFAIWLALRLWADLVSLQHQILARLETPSGLAPTSVQPFAPLSGRAQGPEKARAADDGPAYPDADEADPPPAAS